MRQGKKGLTCAHLDDIGLRYETDRKVEYDYRVFSVEPELIHPYLQTLDEVLEFAGVVAIPLSTLKVRVIISVVPDPPVKPVGSRHHFQSRSLRFL